MTTTAFLPATIAARWQEAAELVGLRVDVPAAIAKSYAVPGQYVQLAVKDQPPAFLAIASPPGASALEFLIKRSDATTALVGLAAGDHVEVSLAQGQGYPVAAHKGHDVLLFAVGSGISPIRSLIGYLAAHRLEYAGVTLFYGARTHAHVPYIDEAAQWEAAGVQVVRMLSRPDQPRDGFAEGYVHEAVRVHPVQPGKTVAFVCGMPAMVVGVAAELKKLGVPAERVFQNF
ncbi:MAG: Heterodisulfide reductase, cytochrome reductase subunit [Cyanobacteria bacterium RYN_339]|nr:Heterodisulfide reductase, cytochrome reductase subunit [Cyanobacteria bacterium RYN_339]